MWLTHAQCNESCPGQKVEKIYRTLTVVTIFFAFHKQQLLINKWLDFKPNFHKQNFIIYKKYILTCFCLWYSMQRLRPYIISCLLFLKSMKYKHDKQTWYIQTCFLDLLRVGLVQWSMYGFLFNLSTISQRKKPFFKAILLR